MPALITWLSSTSGPAAGPGCPLPWSDGPPRVPLCGSAKISTWSSRTVSVISSPSEATNRSAISAGLTSGDGTSTRNPRAVRSPPLLKLMEASKDARYSATRPRLDLRADDRPAPDGALATSVPNARLGLALAGPIAHLAHWTPSLAGRGSLEVGKWEGGRDRAKRRRFPVRLHRRAPRSGVRLLAGRQGQLRRRPRGGRRGAAG